jgi:hypothetical protein
VANVTAAGGPWSRHRVFGLIFALAGSACTSNAGSNNARTAPKAREPLLDPVTCKECHAEHYTEWAGSMHAYASDDPVFRAMNARGQRETNHALGPFCVNCHAPMAVKEGATLDGLNLDDVPRKLHGVTCYFCHDASQVTDTHDAPIALANDTVMHGGIGALPDDPPPARNPVHDTAYSELLDGKRPKSASLCGSCHDIVVPGHFSGAAADVHLERTYEEWRDTLFSNRETGDTCSGCHTQTDGSRTTIASYTGSNGGRRFHRHDWEGIDTALTGDFPNQDRQKALIQSQLDHALVATLCVAGSGNVGVYLDNIGAGHSVPSGATQDRRFWAEVVAYDGSGSEIFQSGVVAPGQPVDTLDDPNLWLFRDKGLDVNGQEAHMFWQIASIAPSPDSVSIPGAISFDPNDPGYRREQLGHVYDLGGKVPDRVTLRVHARPIALDVLNDLVEHGDLSPAVRDAMTLGTVSRGGSDVMLTWTASAATPGPDIDGVASRCVSDPSAESVSPTEQPASGADGGAGGASGGLDAGSADAAPDAPPDAAPDASRVTAPCGGRGDSYVAGLTKTAADGMTVELLDALPAPPALNDNAWTILVKDASGNALDGAQISVTPRMPDHGHGTPIVATVTDQGGGSYLLDPVNLFMAGYWTVAIRVVPAGGTADSVTFGFCIQ